MLKPEIQEKEDFMMRIAKLKTVANKTKAIAATTCTMLMATPLTAYATGGDFFQDRGITINANVDMSTLLNRLVNVFAGAFIMVGIFQIAMSIFALLEAHSEGNSAAVNKAVKQLCIGGIFVGAPLLLKFLFS